MIKLQLHDAILLYCCPDSFVLLLRNCANLKAISYESMSLNRIVASVETSKMIKLQLHDAIHRLRFYSNLLIHILSLSNSHNNVASLQKNRGDESNHVIVA